LDNEQRSRGRLIMSDFSLDKIKDFTMPSQSVGEWQTYLEFIETYFRNRNIESPMIVEIGVGRGKQKKFYEELLGYNHIGIDFKREKKPDIVGNSRDPATVDKLKEKLNGREVNLLFIDDGHEYLEVKTDYELYSPLAKNIIAIHDILYKQWQNTVGKFWNELIVENREAQDRIFITLAGYYPSLCHDFCRPSIKRQFGQGTGLILLEDLDAKYV